MRIDPQAIPDTSVTDAAKTWGQTIAGLLTIGGILTLFQGGGTVQNLQPDAESRLASLLVFALVAAVLAVLLAFSAAFDPDFLGPQGIRLNISIFLTVVAIILLFFAAQTIWDNQVDNRGLYFVTYEQDKTMSCGRVSTGPDGQLLFMDTPVAGVTALTAADKGCPNPTPTP